jgi:hypothetical protein
MRLNAASREERLRCFERGELPPAELEQLMAETLAGAVS